MLDQMRKTSSILLWQAKTPLTEDYRNLFLYRWQRAATELCEGYLRNDLLLPLDPTLAEKTEVWNRVEQGVVLPMWHCGFRGCSATSCNVVTPGPGNHERGMWQHIWHTPAHRQILDQIVTKYKLTETFCRKEETAFTLVNQAYIEQERKSCPQVGLATDRRSLRHLGEVFFEENVEVLMCFVCGCKHIHHKGFDKFGEPYSKATIAYRRDVGDSLRQVLI